MNINKTEAEKERRLDFEMEKFHWNSQLVRFCCHLWAVTFGSLGFSLFQNRRLYLQLSF